MLTYLLLSMTWFAIVFVPPFLAYRRPVWGTQDLGQGAADGTPESGFSL